MIVIKYCFAHFISIYWQQVELLRNERRLGFYYEELQ